MPTAEPFSTVGVYNGFPSCFQKVDVSSFDKWTTFSGWSKDNEPATPELKAASIEESLQLAGKLFWSLHKVSITILLDPPSTVPDLIINNQSFFEFDPEQEPIADAVEPVQRVCGDAFTFYEGGEAPVINQAELELFSRMYEGSTDDEENFVGYGMGLININEFLVANIMLKKLIFGTVDAFVGLGGHSNDLELGGGADPVTYEYVTVGVDNPIHFIFVGGGTVGWVVDTPTLSITLFDDSSSLAIDDLEFWEYA